MEQRGKNYLGIDWGRSKIGIALAHPETGVVLPLGVFKNDETFLDSVEAILKQEDIGTIVLGLPERTVSETSEKDIDQAQSILAFGQVLKERFGRTVEYHNEMFTTKMARESLKEGGKKDLGKRDDAEAARILLESWLQKKNS